MNETGKKLRKYGQASNDYVDYQAARFDTYVTDDDRFPSTNLVCEDNPYKEQLLTAKYILDFGCGVGRNLPWIMNNTSAHYVGLDPNTTMINHFWQTQVSEGHNVDTWKNRVTLYNDFSEIPQEIKFDYVVSTFVLQHLGYRYAHPTSYTRSGIVFDTDTFLNLTDITNTIMSRMNDGAVFFAIEHDSEEDWIPRWTTECNITLDVYIRSYTGLPELCDRDKLAVNGGHHLLIFKN
jgi:SAM-dependent methyltransferase